MKTTCILYKTNTYKNPEQVFKTVVIYTQFDGKVWIFVFKNGNFTIGKYNWLY
jgi:hypothetical protein